MSRTAASVREDSLHSFLTDNHAHLETIFQQLLEAMAIEAPNTRALWTELDRGLVSHMEAEERYVLPSFAHIDRDAARELLLEHAQIRTQLLELGVALDLHALRYEHSQEFIRLLRSHAAREDNLLYRWADTRLDEHLRAATRRHAEAV